MIVKVKNLLDSEAQNTYLSQGEIAGTTDLRIKNSNGFSASWAVQLGKTGEELSEIKVLGTAVPSGGTLTITSGLSFSHSSDTPVYAIKFDQLIFKRSTDGTAGTVSPLTNGTVSITPDSEFTQFDDTTGSITYAYKAAFRNSVTTETSPDSDWIIPDGYSFYALGSLRERVKNKLFSAGFIKSDDVIDEWINEWLEEMNRSAVKVNKGYSMGTVAVPFGSDGLGTITTASFMGLNRMWVTYDGVESFKATKKEISEIFPNEIFTKTHPYYAWRGDSVFQVLPAETGGTANLVISQAVTNLSTQTSELPMVMRPYTTSFVNYALAESYYLDGKDAKGDRYLSRATAQKNDFIAEITPRNFTNVQMMEVTHVIDGMEDYFI